MGLSKPLLVSFALLGFSGAASAATLNFESGVGLGGCAFLGVPSPQCTTADLLEVAGFSEGPGTAALVVQDFRGVSGLGVRTRPGEDNDSGAHGEVNRRLDDTNEGLSILLIPGGGPQLVLSIEFSRLFGPGSGDILPESVLVRADTAFGAIAGTLQLDANLQSAVWTWDPPDFPPTQSKQAVNLSPSTVLGAGWWRIDRPFGFYPINRLTFEPGSNAADFTNDFAFVGIVTRTPVPEPGSLLLFAFALVVLIPSAKLRR